MIEHKKFKGIYLITKKENSFPKYYIGQSNDIFLRFNFHCWSDNSTVLSEIDSDIRKLGIENFIFEILDIVQKQTDRDLKEKERIKEFVEKYGPDSLYNIKSGGNLGSVFLESSVVENRKEKLKNRKEIAEIFKDVVDTSIYKIHEWFPNFSLKEIIEIRKPILKQFGLKYDLKLKKMTNISNGAIIENWQGGKLTENQKKLYEQLKLEKEDLDVDEIVEKLGVTFADFKEFLNI